MDFPPIYYSKLQLQRYHQNQEDHNLNVLVGEETLSIKSSLNDDKSEASFCQLYCFSGLDALSSGYSLWYEQIYNTRQWLAFPTSDVSITISKTNIWLAVHSCRWFFKFSKRQSLRIFPFSCRSMANISSKVHGEDQNWRDFENTFSYGAAICMSRRRTSVVFGSTTWLNQFPSNWTGSIASGPKWFPTHQSDLKWSSRAFHNVGLDYTLFDWQSWPVASVYYKSHDKDLLIAHSLFPSFQLWLPVPDLSRRSLKGFWNISSWNIINKNMYWACGMRKVY